MALPVATEEGYLWFKIIPSPCNCCCSRRNMRTGKLTLRCMGVHCSRRQGHAFFTSFEVHQYLISQLNCLKCGSWHQFYYSGLRMFNMRILSCVDSKIIFLFISHYEEEFVEIRQCYFNYEQLQVNKGV